MNSNWMTITDVADRIGVATKTIVRWENSGKIQKSKRDYRGWRMYSLDDLKEIERLMNAVH